MGALPSNRFSPAESLMPNRKTFDEREKYDHSGRPLTHPQKNDLRPDVSEEAGGPQRAAPRRGGAAVGRTKTGATRTPRD
jgi:hypothetical protein